MYGTPYRITESYCKSDIACKKSGEKEHFLEKKVFTDILKQFMCAWCQKHLNDRYKLI